MTLQHQFAAPISTAASASTASAIMMRENERLRFVTEELHHRIKNLVAVVQSIARQTARDTTAGEAFDVRFSSRLGALGRSLDLLISNDWRGARVDELIRSVLTPFGVLYGAQTSFRGPSLDLDADAARNIGLALHELATNASKYGALSVPEGKVDVRWELVSSGRQRRLRMTWRESGGPIVTEPTRRGFGQKVIQHATARALAGKSTHEFPPNGVRWTLDIPARFVVGLEKKP